MRADLLLTASTLGMIRFVFVDEGTSQVVTRFGKFHKVLRPGLQFFPYFWGLGGRIHKFAVTDPVSGRRVFTADIDTKEIVYDYPKERVISKDNVQFHVNAVLYFRVIDPFKTLFKISDYVGSMRTLVQSILRAEIGCHDLEETYSNRNILSQSLTREADKATHAWGIKVIRLEIKEFEMGEFAQDLLNQKKQEIERRQQVIVAEGLKEAKIKEAEGLKAAQILRAEGKKISALADADGLLTKARAEAEATKIRMRAEAAGYAEVANALSQFPDAAYFMKLNTAESIASHLAKGQATKLFLPNQLEEVLGAFCLNPVTSPVMAPIAANDEAADDD